MYIHVSGSNDMSMHGDVMFLLGNGMFHACYAMFRFRTFGSEVLYK